MKVKFLFFFYFSKIISFDEYASVTDIVGDYTKNKNHQARREDALKKAETYFKKNELKTYPNAMYLAKILNEIYYLDYKSIDTNEANKFIDLSLQIPSDDLSTINSVLNSISSLELIPTRIRDVLQHIYDTANQDKVRKLKERIESGQFYNYFNFAKKLSLYATIGLSIIGSIVGIFRIMNHIFIEGMILPKIKKNTEKNLFNNLIQPIFISQYTLEDIIGYDQEKEQLIELSKDLISQKTHQKSMSSVLLYGPPGTGKTYAVKALAGSSKLPLFLVTVDKLLNECGSIDQRLEYLFEEAKKMAPCIVFFDDIDLLLGNRFGNSTNTITISEKIALNGLLQKLDGIAKLEGVLVIGNTNCIDDIDPALLRSGRFSVKIKFNEPSTSDVRKIVEYYLRKENIIIEKDYYNNIMSSIVEKIISFKEKNVAVIIQYLRLIKKYSKKTIINCSDIDIINKKINL